MQRWTRAVRWPVATCNRIDAHAARAYHVLLCHHSRSFWCCERGWPGCRAELSARWMKQAASTGEQAHSQEATQAIDIGRSLSAPLVGVRADTHWRMGHVPNLVSPLPASGQPGISATSSLMPTLRRQPPTLRCSRCRRGRGVRRFLFLSARARHDGVLGQLARLTISSRYTRRGMIILRGVMVDS